MTTYGKQARHIYDMTSGIIPVSHVLYTRQFPVKMLQPRTPPTPETRIPQYKFNSRQNLDLNLYREILRNLNFWIWWIYMTCGHGWICMACGYWWSCTTWHAYAVCCTIYGHDHSRGHVVVITVYDVLACHI